MKLNCINYEYGLTIGKDYISYGDYGDTFLILNDLGYYKNYNKNLFYIY